MGSKWPLFTILEERGLNLEKNVPYTLLEISIITSTNPSHSNMNTIQVMFDWKSSLNAILSYTISV